MLAELRNGTVEMEMEMDRFGLGCARVVDGLERFVDGFCNTSLVWIKGLLYERVLELS